MSENAGVQIANLGVNQLLSTFLTIFVQNLAKQMIKSSASVVTVLERSTYAQQ
ncbi:MAG TPA: hypothetical protein VIS54_06690 [Psychromonas sp.]